MNEVRGKSREVRVYPNPSDGKFTIQGNSEKVKGNSEIQIYNVFGQLIYFNHQITKSSNYQINLSAAPSGVYLFRVVGAQNLAPLGEGKFVIEK